MRRLLTIFLLLGSLSTFASDAVTGASRAEATAKAGRVVKVLPLFLDLKGHDAISPSLFDRDAYQARLLQHPEEVSALRIDVLWKAKKAANEKLKLRAELRGVGEHGMPREAVLETNAARGFFENWTSLKFDGADYKNFGALVAWRVTLWDGDKMLGEQKSFLW